MNLIMSYIDYNMAGVKERELFSFTKAQTEEIYRRLKAEKQILGSVLIATCNRTELYLSLAEGSHISPFEQLCKVIGIDSRQYTHMSKTLIDSQVLWHLCKVAAGAESQIWGDAQIVSQVDGAIKTAQLHKSSDSILNVAFRLGVSAGKRVKSLIDFKVLDNSTASRAVRIIKENKRTGHVLVIGNGMIGRKVAELLVRSGIHTTMTLRQYKYGENIVPPGVDTVLYGDRYRVLESCDAVVSATLSPHYTVYYEQVKALCRIPSLFLDLALPRDIDPDVVKLAEVAYYDIDQISAGARDEAQETQMKEIEKIIQEYVDDFYRWYHYREELRQGEEA